MNIQGLKDYMQPFIDLIKGSGVEYFWIASGAIRDYYNKTKHIDVDFFFPDAGKRDIAAKYLESAGFKKVRDLPRGYKFSILEKDYIGNSIDLIVWDGTGDPMCNVSTPEEMIKWFDYTVEMAALDCNGRFYCHETFYDDTVNKRLIRNSIQDLYPRMNNMRLLKYIQRGYTIDMENLKIFLEDQEATFNHRRDKKNK